MRLDLNDLFRWRPLKAVACVSTELRDLWLPPLDLLMQSSFVEHSQHVASSMNVEIPSLIGTPCPINAPESQVMVSSCRNEAPVKTLLVSNCFQLTMSLMKRYFGLMTVLVSLEHSSTLGWVLLSARMLGKWLEKHLPNTNRIRLNNWRNGGTRCAFGCDSEPFSLTLSYEQNPNTSSCCTTILKNAESSLPSPIKSVETTIFSMMAFAHDLAIRRSCHRSFLVEGILLIDIEQPHTTLDFIG